MSAESPKQYEDGSNSNSDGDEQKPPTKKSRSIQLDDDTDDKKISDNSLLIATHYNAIEEKGLEERSRSRIYHLRNFNNWIKSQLINEYATKIKSSQKLGSPLRVLDMCCGKGGDLIKWEKAGVTHLICTDIAEVSIEQCQSRFKKTSDRMDKIGKKMTAEFFACDATLYRLREKYRDPSMQLNLVSCQFAFHYCFESLKQAECMIRNAAECLLPGGFFIGTIPDANEIMRRQRENGTKNFGNFVYNIDFICDTVKPPLFGAKYNFKLEGVVDCPEFLVHFPTLVKICRKFGLQLVYKGGFSQFFNEHLEGGKQLMKTMQGLECYPQNNEKYLSGKSEEYQHAADFISQPGNKNKRIGTLSYPEWEAATLYMVFAFKKLKTSWDSEGRPVYE